VFDPLIQESRVVLHLRVTDVANEDEIRRSGIEDRRIRLTLARLEQALVYAAFQDFIALLVADNRIDNARRRALSKPFRPAGVGSNRPGELLQPGRRATASKDPASRRKMRRNEQAVAEHRHERFLNEHGFRNARLGDVV
jgi:hypothetical protein